MTPGAARIVVDNPSSQPQAADERFSLPYGRHLIEEDDVAAVAAAMRSDLLAQGPRVAIFERALSERVGARHGVACSSGTAALHLALACLDLKPGDVCVAPPITFLSTATAALYCGAEVMFCDVDPATGLMAPDALDETLRRARDVGARVRAVLPVHLSGRICDMPAIAELARGQGVAVIEDACHALGSLDAEGRAAGGCAHADATVFSFHPVKTIAAGEGGMVTTNDEGAADRMRRLRNHGVTREAGRMAEAGSFAADGAPNPWVYEQLELGFNYRMNEMEAALGVSQLGKLDRFVGRRRALAARYDRLLAPLAPVVRPVRTPDGQDPSLHLYTVLIDFEALGRDRAEVMNALVARGVGVQVHYIPLYRQPFFRQRYGEMRLPGAEAYYEQVLALPLFPAMADVHADQVALILSDVLGSL